MQIIRVTHSLMVFELKCKINPGNGVQIILSMSIDSILDKHHMKNERKLTQTLILEYVYS
jgi:hypothetical protein